MRKRSIIVILALALPLTLANASPAFATDDVDCTPNTESGCAWTSIQAYGDGLLAKAFTYSWYIGTIKNTFQVYKSGALYWNNGTRTCYSTNYCSHPDTALPNCGPGYYESKSTGWRVGGGYYAFAVAHKTLS